MTCSLANARALLPAFALLLAAGCMPPPGAGDQSQGERYFEVGKSRLQKQDFTGAIAAFDQALQSDPQMASAHYEMAMIFDKELNSPPKALYHYLRALELDPNFQGADLISNRLSVVKMRLASDSLPRIPSPLLQKEIDRLQNELAALRAEYQQALDANAGLRRQLAANQHQPVQSINPVEMVNPAENENRSGTASPSGSAPAEVVESRLSRPIQANTAGRPATHVVEKGETLYGLSRRYGVTVDELKAANPGASARNFQAGRTINIPVR